MESQDKKSIKIIVLCWVGYFALAVLISWVVELLKVKN